MTSCPHQLLELVLPDDTHFTLFIMFLTPIVMVLFTSLGLAFYVPKSSKFPTCGVRIPLGHLARGAIPLIRYLENLRQHKAGSNNHTRLRRRCVGTPLPLFFSQP